MSGELVVAILALVGSCVGSYAGVRVGIARLDERVKTLEREMGSVRARTDRHSTALTTLAARAGVRAIDLESED